VADLRDTVEPKPTLKPEPVRCRICRRGQASWGWVWLVTCLSALALIIVVV
jgi:hypothetical protein